MPEKLVDVLYKSNVIHTFPVLIDDADDVPEEEYLAKALRLAEHAELVPASDTKHLSSRMHVARGGQLLPYGDDRHVLEGTRQGLENVLADRAYFLWLEEGTPAGKAAEHWHRAFETHLRERSYYLWLNEGCPDGRAEDHWHQSVAHETYP